MTSRRSVGALALATCLLGQTPAICAQGLEIMPFGGYRFGGDFFEIVTTEPVDLDGAATLGVVLDVPLADGFQVEGMFTRESARVATAATPRGPATGVRITIDHWQAGGLQAFDLGRVQPFATGTFGLTRYAAEDDSEIRFTVGGGGGVKLFPWSYLGARLEGRLFATFVDADARGTACSPTICLVAIHADIVWQAEFTAGIVVRFR
jgi:hypothetical protein